jgi:hypothetical protein
MTRDDPRRDDLRDLFESAAPRPTAEERNAILRAAEPVLAELAERGGTRTERARRPSLGERLRAAFGPRRLGLAAAVAVVLALVLFGRPPETRDPRTAPLQSWAEHTATSPAEPIRLVAETFARPY